MTHWFKILFVLLVMSLSACGGGGDSSNSSDEETPITDSQDSQQESAEQDSGQETTSETTQTTTTETTNSETETEEPEPEQTENSNDTETTSSENGSPEEDEPETVAEVIRPNILIIISDDQGKDASNQYGSNSNVVDTPNLDELAANGVIFDNAWVTPMCATTRAAILTGLYGFKNGVTSVPGDIDENIRTIQSHLKSQPETADYQTGFFGKWHLGSDNDNLRPNNMGNDHFAGALQGNISDYFSWQLTTDGNTETNTDYQTTKLVDLAMDWLGTTDDAKPWLMWMAFAAPHSPFHLPPDGLYDETRNLTGDDIQSDPRSYYLASIEAIDYEIGRLLDSMTEQEKNNTFIIYIGDNGTPKKVIDTSFYLKAHSKSTIYEGGVNVPMFISGYGVTRSGDREDTLINSTDIFATIMDLVGLETDVTDDDSESFFPLLSEQSLTNAREWIYTEIESGNNYDYAIRNDRYKLHVYNNDGTVSELFFDLTDADVEVDDLLDNAGFSGSDAETAYNELKAAVDELRNN